MSIHPFEVPGSGGLPVRGDVWLPDHVGECDAVPVVVGVHGFKGFRRWGFWPAIAARLNADGFAFLNFDTSHNGVGPGGMDFDEPARFERNTWTREEEDVDRVLAALRLGSLPHPGRTDTARVALLGHSRGGGLAVVHGSRDRAIRGVVALSPVATVLRFGARELAEGRKRGFIPVVNARTGQTLRYGADAIAELARRTDLHDIAKSHAAHLACPLLVVHGEDDEAVPLAEGRRLAASAPRGRFVAVPGADHVLGCRHPWAGSTPAFETFLVETVGFLRANLG
jgi:pimeloyl-ACP methyl ester carboxylesterase